MSKRLVRGAVVGALLLTGAAACRPRFAPEGVVTATPLGSLVRLDWSAATELDQGQTVARYQIEVNGAAVADVAAPATSCVLTGLPGGTSTTIGVTAYDSVAEWSGDRPTEGRLTTTYLTPTGGGAGATVDCVSVTDGDGDRLPDAVETDTGTYVSAADTGTDPAVADSDGDRLSDGDEVVGTAGGLRLPAMGADPLKKDLVMEFDWFDDNAEPTVCGAHSHRPSAAAIARTADAFAAAPVTNPDGTTGVHLIADYGQGGAFTGGNLVADADGLLVSGVSGAEYVAAKNANLAANRRGYVHYVLNAHRYGTTNSSGQAELFGDDLIVSLQCYGGSNTVFTANTIMHEVGHNLGLRHGGNVDTNYKPNYNSVMNYQYQFPGVDTNCTIPGDGKLDYSTGGRASLNEPSLLEANGICAGAGPVVDWNQNGVIDGAPVAWDANGDGAQTALADHDDWSALSFGGLSAGSGRNVSPPELITEQPAPR